MTASPTNETSDPPRGIASTVGLLVDRIERADNGTQADLRRMDATGTKPLAFHRLTADLKTVDRDSRHGKEHLWGALTSAIATIPGRGNTSFGTALARADLSEMRLARLLQADSEQLPGQVRAVVHLLDSKGQSHIDWRQLAFLLVGRDHERAAREIARDYFRNRPSDQ